MFAKDQRKQPVKTAERIIEKFGGAPNLLKLLRGLGYKVYLTTIYRWTYPRSRQGTQGHIPQFYWNGILKAARLHGIKIKLVELSPTLDELKVSQVKTIHPGGKEPLADDLIGDPVSNSKDQVNDLIDGSIDELL